MADKVNSNQSSSYNFLPRFYRSDANKKFTQATVDQLVQSGTVKKINGFIGRQNSKATTGHDIFIAAPSIERQDYQLEPGLTVKDSLDEVTFFKDYQDYINQLGVFGANTSNHARLNKQEFYSWDPHIDWDKFVNFQNYYWLPYGPDVIKIAGQQQKIESTYTVKLEAELDIYEYVFTPNGLSRNPTLTLYRGQTYTFEIDSVGNPFSIKTLRTPGTLDRYKTPDFNQFAIEQGTLTITIPYDAPNVLYYVSEASIDLGGVINVLSIDENTAIDVEQEIVGKKNYQLADGTPLSNGMLISFIGHVTPASYAKGQYYVEGVGSQIVLINKDELELISAYTSSESVLFDSTSFDQLPFSDATAMATTLDYHTINRASLDKNAWTRYNRWFHKDVINASASFNNKIPSLDQTARAVRPIIEFEAGLKLFNFGTVAQQDIDLIDTFTTDVFSTIEGSFGYNIDGIPVSQGQRILFTADTDVLVKNKIYRVEFIDVLHINSGSRQIHLVLESEPTLNETVLVRNGKTNTGVAYWYDGATWIYAQQKLTTNQAPLFDISDDNGVSFGDITTYEGSTFRGTKLFSYKKGSGTVDSNLGFALSYKNISNIGDIVFNFNILTDTFQYKNITKVISQSTDVGYLTSVSPVTQAVTYENGWKISTATNNQAGIRIYKNSNQTNNFNIDIFDDINSLDDLVVRVYVNGIRLDHTLWNVVTKPDYKQVVLNTDITATDVLTIRTFANQPINANGYYEIPINLQNNPLNGTMADFTLGEVIDHVTSIVDNLPTFVGAFPGASNIRDLGNVTSLGTKFVQHSGPISLSAYHITSEASNVIRAIEQARDDYNKFKRNFISIIDNLDSSEIDDPIAHVNLILQTINKDKPTTSPYYFSDMLGYSASMVNSYPVIDYRIKTYPVSQVFDLDKLSHRAVYVYLNSVQLLHKRDYTFDTQGFVVISAELANDDIVTVYEYDSTDGCFIPATPTKLGIYPKYEPQIYLDTALVTPRTMIQGHDGSQVLAYGDYRDNLVLELEKRIFNNIKVEYNPDIFDISDILPSYVRPSEYSIDEFNEVMAPLFYKWTGLIDKDFSKPLSYDRNNSLTFNYAEHTAPDGRFVPGYWRGVYRWMYDTDRPNLCPWEMLGITVEPTWWNTVYGPSPYTSDNLVMWQDIAAGIVREPGVPPVTLNKYVRPFLLDHLPVDESGNIVSPYTSELVSGTITRTTAGDFTFGDVSPIEAAWRRSSHYPFGLVITALLLRPASVFGTLLDRSRIVRNLTGQLIYKDTGLRVRPADIILPSIYSSTTRIQTSGIVNYVVDYILSANLESYSQYTYDLDNIFAQLSYRIGGFTSKEKFNLLLDSRTPTSTGNVFVPQEDYSIILNTSSPIRKIIYSGIIITKLSDGFEVKGYSKLEPFFKYYPWLQSGATINVGGISESYTLWTVGSQYVVGKIVKYENKYYRVKTTHTSTTVFDLQYFQPLGSLPIQGGKEAVTRILWDRVSPVTVPYGTKFRTIQDTYDFIIGYGEYLKDQGFIFDDYNTTLNAITNWVTSAKEFLFWTTQNWSSGQDKWEDWLPDTDIAYQAIVKYNGDYYQATRKVMASGVFQTNDFVKLDGLSSVGSSVISLSPAATKLTFSTPLCVVDDIRNAFNGYEIYKVDGSPITSSFIDSYREDNAVSYSPRGEDGIFGATFYLIQKEQVVLLNNNTMFGDTIYNQESGYRQERIKVSGYVSTNWVGSFDAPGFIFDQAKISDWSEWTDYALGDVVKYKEFYYSALSFIPGAEAFTASEWTKLSAKPTPRLLPNWTYKASQFTDFYSLDSDNFDVGQQKMAQHLIGYQKRQYLDNIIQDDVSEFKFYQGMIIEKGTQNSLNKLFDVLSAEGVESLKFYEEWALRVGQYGASAAFENIEFTLDESLFKNNPQGFELVNTIDPTVIDFIVRQTPNDIYLKPLGYNNNPWPLVSNYTPYLRTPGFVRADEVTAVLKTIDNLYDTDSTGALLYPITSFNNGSYIWVGFEGREWNVYRYSPTHVNVSNITYTSNVLTITTDSISSLTAGTYIGIENVSFAGFYKITSVSVNNIIIETTISNWTPFVAGTPVRIFALTSQLADSIDSVDSTITTDRVANELLWTKDSGDGKWATWKYNNVYTPTSIRNTLPSENLEFGKNIAISGTGNVAVVSENTGQVSIYGKPVPGVAWTKIQTLNKPLIAIDVLGENPNNFEWNNSVNVFSADGNWLALGSPLAGNASTNYIPGGWNNSVTYLAGQIVLDGTVLYQALKTSLAHRPSTSPTEWKVANLIETVSNGVSTGPQGQGAVSIYVKNSIGLYSFVTTFVSPQPVSDENFGSNLAFGDNVLFITADTDAGKVYQVNYKTRVQATALYNPVGSKGTTIKVSDTTGIQSGMTVVGTGFTANQIVVNVVDSTTLLLDAAADGDAFGRLNFTLTSWAYNDISGISGTSGSRYGSSLAVSKDSTTLVVGAPGVTANGSVFVYRYTDGVFALSQTINGTDNLFGQSLTISDTADYLAISSILDDSQATNQGKVMIFSLVDGQYVNPQTINNIRGEQGELFGSKIAFMNDYKTIVIYSAAGDVKDPWNISDNTTFDDSTTSFSYATNLDNGRIDIYDLYAKNWVYGESLLATTTGADGYGVGFAVGSNHIFVGAPYATDSASHSGLVFEYSKTAGAYSWTTLHKEIDKVDLTKVKSAFLYNTKTNKLISYIDVVDPVQGKIPGPAEQEIKFKTFYDPAVYSVGGSSVTVDDGIAWKKSKVGMLWWDLRTVKFLDSAVDDTVYRNSTWNTLFPGATIDIYEWVASSLKPADWNTQADTEAGLANGVSGTTLYDNTVYSVDIRYDSISKSKIYTYYYWVKNKKTIPNSLDRHMSAQDVSSLIGNTRGQGYQYLALTSSNSFSLVNAKNNLVDKDVALSVQYWTADHQNQNIHSQWKLISDNIDTTLPAPIEQKWIDSLCGKDSQGRLVPDPALPPKIRYGVENRPRQGMFINRFEALKELLERVNRALISEQIVGQRDLSLLETYELEPSASTGLYDTVFDTDAELRFANVGSFAIASVVPVIVNGKITGVNVITAGRGYAVAPYIDVVGTGKGATIRAIINSKGQVTGATVISQGYGYDIDTTLSVRSYSALVHSDTQALGNWSIYSYDPTSKVWSRIRSQSYDTRNYWTYADWYATNYSQFSLINYAVDTFADLNALVIGIGQTVKIRTSSNGGWFILEKYADSASIDWTQSYKVVGQQNGTIQFDSSLYAFIDTSYGYDGALYDGAIFDNSATTELRNILISLKDKILIDTLKQTYLDLFFASVRYALSEQTYLDWVFKTSFVKAQHNVGPLHQPVTYKNDNLPDFEAYVAEVKPYRTKVREYISTYNDTDLSETLVTDFDLQPAYENGGITVVNATVVNDQIVTSDNVINTYPWKNWFDNVGFKITSLKLVDNGALYHTEPVVRFISNSGSGATARAFIVNGKVNRIVLTNQGSSYLSAPTVLLEGGLKVGGTSARAVAIIGDGLARSNLIKMKFDRVTRTYFITQLEETASLVGTGSRLQFPLNWAPDMRIGKTSVTIDGIDVLRDDYKLVLIKSTARGYTSYSGSIIFTTAPVKGASIVVNYVKDWSLLNAADRIQYYYNPTTGELGKDLAQLMNGVDYGGVIVDGLGFNVSQGWDSVPYFSERWDSADPTYDDYITTVSAGQHDFQLSYVPELHTQLNVYHIPLNGNPIRLDDPFYGAVDQTNTSAIMSTIDSTGVSSTPDAFTYDVSIPSTYVVGAGDTIIIRKSTSDGSIKPQTSDYDTALTGGDMAYSSATGLNADDIIVDGDGFVTTTTSPATEEVVPGFVFDTVAVKVFDRPYNGSANIKVDNYVGNNANLNFAISQRPNSKQAVIVKVTTGTTATIMTVGDDYIVDYINNEIVFTVAPPAKSIVSIFSFGFNGSNILDIDYFVGNGETLEFITKAPWLPTLTYLLYVNGEPYTSEIFETDSTYDEPNRVGIRFGLAPQAGDIVTYTIVSGNEQTFAVTKTERIATDGSLTYSLANKIGDSLPIESNMLVRVNQTILKGPTNSYFTLASNRLTYTIDPNKFLPYSIDISDLLVYADGNLLALGTDYTVDLSVISLKITKTVYNKYKGKTLTVNIKHGAEYVYVPAVGTHSPQITFTTAYTSNDVVEVISSYKHDILDIERTSITVNSTISITPDTTDYYVFTGITGGYLQLDRQVIDESYVWVTKNKILLTPNVDYVLFDDKQTVKLAVDSVDTDEYSLITYGGNVLKPGVAYMQFKDMLNRDHFKRLSLNKQTRLVAPLNYNDTTITVVDASMFDIPNPTANRPGIVEIRGERIEYFKKTGNVLSQLRRGTLGTGTPSVHPADSYVQDIGPSETIPYSNSVTIDRIVSDGTNIVPLKFTPTKATETWTYGAGFVSSIPSTFGQSDELEVFVGGYVVDSEWATGVAYIVGTIVTVGSYTYRCITDHTSSATFMTDIENWQFFVGNIRLKKAPYQVYNVNIHPESPEGDIQLDAEFAVDGESQAIRLTTPLTEGTQVTVVRRGGFAWDSQVNVLNDTNKMADFLKATPGIWYSSPR